MRRGADPAGASALLYPRGSVGEAYQRALKLRDAEQAAKGKVQIETRRLAESLEMA